MSRIRPYTTNQQTWGYILGKQHNIPMNNRQYTWGYEEIQQFLADLIFIFKEGIYIEKMGSIVNLDHDNNNDIYDGQQRTISIILVLVSLANFCPKLEKKIFELLSIDPEIDNMNEYQNNVAVMYPNAKTIPKIHCVNPHDMEAIVQIFNGYIPYYKYYTITDNNKYKCKKCEYMKSGERSFKEHIKTEHGWKECLSDTKIYKSYEYIHENINSQGLTTQDYIDLYKFIMNDIDIQYYNVTDPKYAGLILNWDNNRGRGMEQLDIHKNQILSNVPAQYKCSIYDDWESFRTKTHKFYKDYGKHVMDISIQLYNGKIERKPDYDELYKCIVQKENSYEGTQELFKICKNVDTIITSIENDKFGKLLFLKQSVKLTSEALWWCIVPILHTIKKMDEDMIKMFTVTIIAGIVCKPVSFNSLIWSNKFLSISNELLKNPSYNYSRSLLQCFQENYKNGISIPSKDIYFQTLSEYNFQTDKAAIYLLLLEKCMSTDIAIVSTDVSIEHISPQKENDKKNNNLLGNLTLYELKNSPNHRGNSSLGALSYIDKKPHYKESSFKLTRELCDNYESWDIDSIAQRTHQLGLNMYDIFQKIVQ